MKTKSVCIVTAVLGVLLFGTTFAQQTEQLYPHIHPDGTVRLPVELLQHELPLVYESSPTPELAGMRVLRNSVTGKIHRAWGRPLRITGYETISDDNIHDAAEAFLREHGNDIGVSHSTLELKRVSHANGRWYVSYTQVHEGYEVLLSEVELRIFANGNVAAFGASVFPDIPSFDKPAIDATAAWASALEGLDEPPSLRKTADLPRVCILPIQIAGELQYHLVAELAVEDETKGGFLSYVDIHDGRLLWRRSTSFDIASSIRAHGAVTLVHPNEATLTDVPFTDMYITVGGQRHTTDASGRVQVDITAPTSFSAGFEGPWAKINVKDRTNANFSGLLQPGEDAVVHWTDGNSHLVERVLFFHTNNNRAYVKSIDPATQCLDIQMQVQVEFGGQMPNAASNGTEIMFQGVGDPSMRMGSAPMVLYHELGHSLNTLLYQELGDPQGMMNAVCQEGMADLHASLIVDDSRMGLGVFADDEQKIIRNLDNTLRYPDDITGDSHHDGQILGGAFWDLRKATSLDLVRRLAHYARYGLPDDPNNGVAFTEWFLETLIADDDDGDLSNGTPNGRRIAEAFDIHGIGPGLLMQSALVHTPYPDTRDTLQNYTIEFCFGFPSTALPDPERVRVQYTIGRSGPETLVEAQSLGNGCYRAVIPRQAAGSMVSYRIQVLDPWLQSEFLLGDGYGNPFVFFVGFVSVFTDDFETHKGWTVGSNNDNATQGRWERARPEEVDLRQLGGPYMQPGEDHTPGGSNCYVTGARGGYSYMQHLPDGRTTLTSPPINLEHAPVAAIRLYYYFFNMVHPMMGRPEDKAQLLVESSSDNGGTWTRKLTIDEGSDGWRPLLILIDDTLELSKQTRLRVVLDVKRGPQGMPASFSKALVDDVEVLTALSNLHMRLGTVQGSGNANITLPLHLITPMNNEFFHPLSFTLEYDSSCLKFNDATAPAGALLEGLPITVTPVPTGIHVSIDDGTLINGSGLLMEFNFQAGALSDTCTDVIAVNPLFDTGRFLPIIEPGTICIRPPHPLVISAIDGPAELRWDGDVREYIPNPFEVTGRFTNVGGEEALGASYTITYDSADVVLSAPLSDTQTPAQNTIAPSTHQDAIWQLEAKRRTNGDSTEICITASFDNHQNVTSCLKLYIPQTGPVLDCLLDAPEIVADDENLRYAPMPFPLTVAVTNSGGMRTGDLHATITLAHDLELASPDAPDAYTKRLFPAALSSGQRGSVSWNIQHPVSDVEKHYVVTVLVWSDNADSTTCETTIRIPGLPIPTFSTVLQADGPLTFCEGYSVVLDAGSGYAAYRWSNGHRNQLLTVTESGAYYCTVEDQDGRLGHSDTLHVTVIAAPAPRLTVSGSIPMCENDSVIVHAGDAYLAYLWNTGATESSIIVRSAGSYYATVWNTDTCMGYSDTVVVTTLPIPPTPVIQRIGDVLSTGYAYSYQWYRDGLKLPEAGNQYLALAETGVYQVMVTDENGCSSLSDPYEVTVLNVEPPVSASDVHLNVYPDPAHDNVNVQLLDALGHVHIVLCDVAGRIDHVFSGMIEPAESVIPISLHGRKPGVYFVVVLLHDTIHVRKLMKL